METTLDQAADRTIVLGNFEADPDVIDSAIAVINEVAQNDLPVTPDTKAWQVLVMFGFDGDEGNVPGELRENPDLARTVFLTGVHPQHVWHTTCPDWCVAKDHPSDIVTATGESATSHYSDSLDCGDMVSVYLDRADLLREDGSVETKTMLVLSTESEFTEMSLEDLRMLHAMLGAAIFGFTKLYEAEVAA